jgi:hypothetical protein
MKRLRTVTPVVCVLLLLAACSSAEGVRPVPYPPPSVVTPKIAEPQRQLGVDIDFYANPGPDVDALARQDIAYIKSLHANAVSITIPFFSNAAGTAVGAEGRTPDARQLGDVIGAAERAGLAVTLRPLLDEKFIGRSRVLWEPADLSAWFVSYEKFLLPYATLAQRYKVAVFAVGVEFTRFSRAGQWRNLDSAIRSVYRGTLAYSNNWTSHERPMSGNGGPGVVEMTDAYPPFDLPDDAPPAALAAAWARWARPLPRGTILSEVGISSRPGAYLRPYQWGPIYTPLLPQIQVNWFDAACQAIATDQLGGLYFWTFSFGQLLTAPASVENPGSFVKMPGQTAIARCFSASLAGA